MLQALHLGMLAAYFCTTLDIKIQIYWMGLLYHLLGYRLWIALRLTSKGLVALKWPWKLSKDSETLRLKLWDRLWEWEQKWLVWKLLLDVKPVAHLRKYTLTLTILILPVMINALEKKMAASVGEKPTLSKPVMMMMVSTLAAPHLFDHYRRIVLSVGQIIALRKTESFFLVFLCKSPLVHTFRIS